MCYNLRFEICSRILRFVPEFCDFVPEFAILCQNLRFKICEDYRVTNYPMKYRDKKFYWSYQRDVVWPNDYLGPDSMTRWIIENQRILLTLGCMEYQRASEHMHI